MENHFLFRTIAWNAWFRMEAYSCTNPVSNKSRILHATLNPSVLSRDDIGFFLTVTSNVLLYHALTSGDTLFFRASCTLLIGARLSLA